MCVLILSERKIIMKIYRKALIWALSILLCALGVTSLSGCGDSSAKSSSGGKSNSAAATEDEAKAADGLADLGIDPGKVGVFPNVRHDKKNSAGFQLEQPKDGDAIAVIHTGMGDITLRFFPDQAPKAVTNFINLAKSGSYNKTSFHKVIADFAVQGGHCGSADNNPSGTSSYGGVFEDEFCDSLLNLRGAVSMASNSKDSNGSQFLITQTSAEAFKKSGGWTALSKNWDDMKEQLKSYKDSNLLSAFLDENGDRLLNTSAVPESVKKLYEEHGGNPTLDGAYNASDRGCTVFAQVISGMDVVDKIAATKTDKKNVPLERVQINSVEVTAYSANSVTEPAKK